MATLVLTAAGTAIGGPIGGAIGALIGQGADAALFAPKRREGPRLGDLAVQTSSYGAAIPKLFGTIRAAGTVIWATDLREDRTTSGGGKGNQQTTSYSYSASFAVALSGRPVRAVRRIWADGKLLRGAAGDFKVRTGFRLYPGGETQTPDPAIAAAEGIGQAPAFRGIAYAMFEDLALGEYGNRIPSLTFEVEADPAPMAMGRIAEALSGGSIRGGDGGALAGFAATGDTLRGALEGMADALALSVRDEGDHLILAGGGEAMEIGEEPLAHIEIVRQALSTVPAETAIVYHDPARDYQAGMQRARLDGGAFRAERLALPAVLDAREAKQLAEAMLAARLAGRVTARLRLPWRAAPPTPGSRVRLGAEGEIWRVARRTVERGAIALDLVRVSGGSREAGSASPGRNVREPDLPHGPTSLLLLDIPWTGETGATGPVAIAAGASAGWRKAPLEVSLDGGGTWISAGETAPGAVLGRSVARLGPGGSTLFDDRNAVDVELLSDSMWLEGRDDAALVNGANLAVIGSEMVQFGRAEPIGARRFRLSRLLRGRRGTEWAADGHAAGEDFALLSEQSSVRLPIGAEAIGAEAVLMANGIGDLAPSVARCEISGEVHRPPMPVHVSARWAGDDLLLRWTRRSRVGWAWQSGADTPLGEERETYRVTIEGVGRSRTMEVSEPLFLYSGALRLQDGNDRRLAVRIVQIGTHAPSRPARIDLR